jgi:hypothetical protein
MTHASIDNASKQDLNLPTDDNKTDKRWQSSTMTPQEGDDATRRRRQDLRRSRVFTRSPVVGKVTTTVPQKGNNTHRHRHC